MKTKICIFAISLAAGLTSSWAQDTWVQKANFGGTGRYGAVGFSIGSKGYMGCGYDFNSGHKNDFWEYDPGTNSWTQKADFGGLARETPVGFAIGSKGYIGTGYHFGGVFKDFYEYDPASNTWTQKADFGGTARNCATGFSLGGKGYIGTGIDDSIETKDFWEYDPSLNSWTEKADFGGAGRHLATAFAIGDKGYIATGQDNFGGELYEDIWEYDPSTDTWNQKADFGGGVRTAAGGFSIGATGYIAMGGDASGNRTDLWQYNPSTNLWTQKADFPGTARTYFATFTIGSNGYIGIGDNYPNDLRDVWEYIPGESSSTCLPPPPGLVSWWSGDKTADDVQGTNNGTLKNGASFRQGKVGPGFLFDGIDDAVVIPNSPSLSQTRITLDAWVYGTGRAGEGRHIISKDNEAVVREWVLGIASQDKFEADIWLPNQILVMALGTTTVQLNTWYHVAMTHDGTKLRLYVNGVLETTSDAVGTIVPTDNPVGIGQNTHGLGGSVAFQGIIDEAQVFNRALSDDEILSIYQAGVEGQCKPEIFVSSIDSSYTAAHSRYLITTSLAIQDSNGAAISGASANIEVRFPSGSKLVFQAKPDKSGEPSVSFYSSETGTYRFKVLRVSHPIREYDASLNIETSDTLLIP